MKLSRNQFHLAFREMADEIGESVDPYDCEVNWRVYDDGDHICEDEIEQYYENNLAQSDKEST